VRGLAGVLPIPQKILPVLFASPASSHNIANFANTESQRMHTSLVLTVIGPDRPGLVEAIAAVIARHGANWEESRMAQLGGQFAGMLRVTAPEETQDALEDALAGLGSVGLKVTVARAAGAQAQVPKLLHLNLVGQDRPGIVREIAEQHGASVSLSEARPGQQPPGARFVVRFMAPA